MKKEVVVNDFIKPSNAIHLAHNFSLMQILLWDFILSKTSQEDIALQEYHTISMATLVKFLGNTRNIQHIKKSLESMSSVITYPVINKDGEEWGCFPLFSHAFIENGKFEYSYSRMIKKFLASPTVYSRINLSTLVKFDCKYGLFLYQLCLDYQNVIFTPWFSLEKFCLYMGVSSQSYTGFNVLNYHVIKKAIAEVNKKSDLFVRAEYQRDFRKNRAIRFVVYRKDFLRQKRLKEFKKIIDFSTILQPVVQNLEW